MHGVVLPQPPAVEKTVRPIGDDILADEENQHLYDERQRRERSVAVLVEGDQALGGSDVKEHGRASDEQADAEIAGDDWNKEPVAHIGDEVALAPPRPARIAAQNWVSTVKSAASASEIGMLFINIRPISTTTARSSWFMRRAAFLLFSEAFLRVGAAIQVVSMNQINRP